MDQLTERARTQDRAALATPSHLDRAEVRDVAGALSILLADVSALYLKTKNFHWHMSGPRFRDYHLVLDDQAEQIFAMTDVLAERRARSADPRSARSVTSIACSAYSTMTQILSRRRTCWPNCAKTIASWRGRCAKRVACASITEIMRRRAYLTVTSTRLSGGSGSCSK